MNTRRYSIKNRILREFIITTFTPFLFASPGALWAFQSPIYVADHFSIYNSDERPCNNYSYKVLVKFDNDEDRVYSKRFLKETLFSGLIQDLKSRYCPNAKHELSALIFIENITFDEKDFVVPLQEAKPIFQKPSLRRFVSVSVYNETGDGDFSTNFSERLRLNVRYREGASRDWLNYEDQVELMGSLSLYQEFVARGKRTKQDHADFSFQKRQREKRRAAYDEWLEEEKQASNWPFEDNNWLLKVWAKGGYVTKAPPFHLEPIYDRKGEPYSFYALAAYVELSNSKCGSTSPNGTTLVNLKLTTTNRYGTSREQIAKLYVDKLLAQSYIEFREAHGGYNAVNVIGIGGTIKELTPLFEIWKCGGREHGRFINGLLISNQNTP